MKDETTATETDNLTGGKAVPRRNFLKCMAVAGGGVVWTVSASGLLTACGQVTNSPPPPTPTDSFSFIQLSDTHIGFNSEGVNTDVAGTLKQAIERINALPKLPSMVLHTGDITHNSKPDEFDMAAQLLGTIKAEKVFYVPGEHDVIGDMGAGFRQKFLPAKAANSWYSFDYKGVHFIALSNAGELDAFGMLGTEQLDWLKKDLAGVKKDTPLIVFAHVPLYPVYPAWGWETKDGNSALAMLMPYSAVTVLNGHIHQVLTKVDGNIHFSTANATAFPQHRPGVDKPNAYKLPANELLQLVGYRSVTIVPGKAEATIADTTLAGTAAATETVAPVSTTAAPTANTSAVVNADGTVDVGAVADFSAVATTPKAVTLQLPNQKKPVRLFIIQNSSEYQALSDICTHQGCEVDWNAAKGNFLCPCHGSEYDRQGQNVAGPAPKPLSRYKITLANGRLMLSVPSV